MNKVIKTIFVLVVFGIVIFFFQKEIKIFWNRSFSYYFPCKIPIEYSLGTFDTEFNLSKTDFLSALTDAEDIWEKSIGRNLFQYTTDGSLKINLIYDIRQESTDQLKNIGVIVDNSRASYNILKSKYDTLSADYLVQKNLLQNRLSAFKIRQKAYEDEVERINRHGGGNKDTVNRLNIEKNYLNQEAIKIDQLQNDLNTTVKEINIVVSSINQMAKSLNIDVGNFNTVGASLGGEFDEGVYKSGPDGQEIDIYQFENRAKLIRVLAHELGHALGLDHNDNVKAIMYRLNNGINEKITDADLSELKNLCGIK